MSGDAVVYLAGSGWDEVAGTDRRLATALAAVRPVIWIDPPVSMARRGHDGRRRLRAEISHPVDGLTRVRTVAPPAVTRPGVRAIARAMTARQVRRAVAQLGAPTGVVVNASAGGRFPAGVPGARVLYATDDWPGGAELMGLSRDDLLRTLRRNAADADLVLAVSPVLAEVVAAQTGTAVAVLANGTEPVLAAPTPPPAGSPALLIGQLNERLDLDVLEALVGAGLPLTVVGPRAVRDPAFGARLDDLLRAPGVTWTGLLPPEELNAHLASASVGITPYAMTDFNRSSFPLKTLEYLGAGLPVVSTDLPAARWLGTDDVDVVATPAAFAHAVGIRIATGRDADADARRIAFAREHSWQARATRLLTLSGAVAGERAEVNGR
jgi:teichuronic acid biosynthesis glycosyltransferase TuaH